MQFAALSQIIFLPLKSTLSPVTCAMRLVDRLSQCNLGWLSILREHEKDDNLSASQQV